MASTIAEIREALRAAIANGTAGKWQVSAYMLALPKPPAIDIARGSVTYDTAMDRGADDLEFTVRAFVAFSVDGLGTQVLLDTLIDSTSSTGMKTILEVDKTLGGVVDDLRVESASEPKGVLVDNQPPMLCTEFTVLVYV
jgi:hypothetical protein